MAVRLRVTRWAGWTGAGWLAALCVFGAAFVAVVLGAPGLLLRAAAGLAAGATVAFGSRFGRRGRWRNPRVALLAGVVVLVCWAEAVWVAMWFVPYAGGSGGFLAILAPLFIGVLGGVAALAALAVMLAAGELAGLSWPGRPVLRCFTMTASAVAVAGLAAVVSAPVSRAGSYGVDVVPAYATVVGAWKGPRAAVLRFDRDGTFTATGLPAGIGDWSSGSTPVSGGGTWQVGRPGAGVPPGVILDFSNGSQAGLQVETAGPSSLALYYDLGDPDEGWSGQYRFVRQ